MLSTLRLGNTGALYEGCYCGALQVRPMTPHMPRAVCALVEVRVQVCVGGDARSWDERASRNCIYSERRLLEMARIDR